MNRKQGCILIAMLVAVSSVRAEADDSTATTQSDEQQVIAIETAWVDAEVKRDEAVLERVLDERSPT